MTRNINIIASILACAVAAVSCGSTVPCDTGISVVPVPAQLTCGEGVFVLSPSDGISVQDGVEGMDYVCDAFAELCGQIFGKEPVCVCGSDDSRISVSVSDDMLPESYSLDIAEDRIEIVAGDAAGAYYAIQTLRQLLPVSVFGEERVRAVELPVISIEDSPEMNYRGVMLDVARHFFTVEEVKTFIDIIAMHKMNIFHWHLTDDQGWRIEIKKYPHLTSIGSVRKRTLVGKDPGGEYDENTQYDETPHGGFYTQDEIRDIVDYAARHFITVIPEIEFPGHAVAALASYPWLGCTGEQYEVRQTWDIDDRVFCLGKETTFEFMDGVLSEVIELFPSEYIHIGGDECPVKMWEQCPMCKQRMKNEGLKSFRNLQGYAVGRIEKFLNANGRSLIGWDEILEAGVNSSAIVMSWRGTEGGIKAAKQGNRAIMSPSTYCYFDYYQTADRENEPLAWGGCLPIDKVYSFDPYEGLDGREKEFIIGVQANLWTEYIPTLSQAEYMLLPRLAALSETAWSYDRKNYEDFIVRLQKLTDLYDILGYERR